MNTVIRIFCILVIMSSVTYCQSYMTFDAGTDLNMQSGADICADKVVINGSWTGDGTICDGVMPVLLSSFTASVTKNNVKLIWVTTGEINNSGFDVERKLVKEGTSWQKISFVTGNGTTDITRIYSFQDKKMFAGRYNYRLKQIDFNGNYEYFALESEIMIEPPHSFSMSQNYPNPSNPKSIIDYEIPVDGKVTIKLYDITGSEVAVVVNEIKPAGYYTVELDGTNLASGIYFYRITTGKYAMTKRMVLVK